MSWQPSQARALYNIPQWSEGYVDVNSAGHLSVRPFKAGPEVDLAALAMRLPREGLELPVLVRFTDILRDRVDALTGAFAEVIREYEYGGRYTAVYPIKVNQQKSVVEAILEHGGERVGIEAGSKPELAAVLGLARSGSVCLLYTSPSPRD